MLGKRLAEDEKEVSEKKVHSLLTELGFDPTEKLASTVFPMAELWAALRKLSQYEQSSWQHKTELVGLRHKVAELAQKKPELWEQSLCWILLRSSTLGNIAQALTLELASTNQSIRNALEYAQNDKHEQVRLRARGVWVLLQGFENPEAKFCRTLADAAARYMDGTPIFPHPLEPMSSTWLGSLGVENALTDGIRRATERFSIEVRDQGGDIEEALTKALMKELEVEFRNTRPRLPLYASPEYRSQLPVLSLKQRPTSKSVEEPIYGCDIAFLVNATVRGRYNATWVDLVQIKKSSAIIRNTSNDSWKIESKQLNDIINWSPTATYWLIAGEGEVLVIPAKYLLGIKCGTEIPKGQKTFTVGYHEIRSAAIPLPQFIVNLVIGQWVGTTEERVVRFARGEDSKNIRPRVLVEIVVSVGNEDINQNK
jgi:hypothetical protein